MTMRRECASSRIQVDTLLAAESLDTATIDRLASRENYAEAADTLQQRLGCSALVKTMLGVPSGFAPLRFALALGVYPPDVRFLKAVSIDDLRAAASPRAKLALILLGEPFVWRHGDKTQRAAFALRELVHRMFDRR
jgi:hypothetical protein